MSDRNMCALLALFLLALPSCSRDGGSEAGDVREVTVTMGEFYFQTTDSIFEAGVPYRFVLRNEGQMPHEWAVVPRGDADESRLLFEVEEDDLPPGATVTREFTFHEAGEYDFACYMPGHYEGGMILPVRVRSAG
jgi:uncharacterized cupredoxin-like copper-binding protein